MPAFKILNSLWDAGHQKLHGAAQSRLGRSWVSTGAHGERPGDSGRPCLAMGWTSRILEMQTSSSMGTQPCVGQPSAPVPFLCPRHRFPLLAHRAEDRAVGPPPGEKAKRRPGGSSWLHTHTGTAGPNHSRDTEHEHSILIVYLPEETKC